ncbi:indole-3-glycerol phosphate synthase TrpC [Candidatus Margulisiibacteriota bacterium]
MLDKILKHKQIEVAQLKKTTSTDTFLQQIDATQTRDFANAISQAGKINVIAEIKKASPSKGVLIEHFNPAQIAGDYTSIGAAALSVLTDEKFFQGSNDNISLVKQVSELPILRKDFIIDDLQLYESRAIGADAVLLIASILTAEEISSFLKTIHKLDMEALVEIHNEDDLNKVMNIAGIRIIGINNRNLTDFKVDLNTTKMLLPKIPKDKIIVSESGMFKKDDIPQGVNAVLIGEGLLKNSSLIQ